MRTRSIFAAALLSIASSFSIAAPALGRLHAPNRLRPVGSATARPTADALDSTLDYLARNRVALGLAADDLDQIALRDRYRSDRSGLTHLYLRQQVDDIDVEGSDWVAAVDRSGRIVSLGDRMVRNLRARVETRAPEISAADAVLAAARELGIDGSLASRRPIGGNAQQVLFESTGISREPILARLAFVATDAGPVRISWNFQIQTLDGRHWWDLFVDAQTGALLERHDWIARDSYNVYPPPVTSPDAAARSESIDPADSVASAFGWHDTDGIAGAEFTDTRGNNVFAQEDNDADNTGGLRPDGGTSLDFDFPVDFQLHPSSYAFAAITNVFYWNNYMHDVLYRYGFDEAAGNFQQHNYGHGGIAGDPVQADAQDGSGANNAQFATPPDGTDPRMELFLFVDSSSTSLELSTPAEIAGVYQANAGTFGGGSDGLTAPVVLAIDLVDPGGPDTNAACSALANPAELAGNIALVDRGGCTFVQKTANVQAAGAIGIIIVNNEGDELVDMSGIDPALVIPPIFIGRSDGDTIKGQLGTGVVATIVTAVARGASFDNGIIAHEYGHGVSNRLTGGPSNAGCITTTQPRGLGEGWSDWLALTMTADSSDTAIAPRPIGAYAMGSPPTGPGIRNHPYSRDLAASPLTLADIATLNQPHGIGEVWASALWDLYWNFEDAYGFDPDLYTGSGGNNRLIQLVLDAMKLQPCNPTFLDARDALLLADDVDNAGVDQCLIWEAFARRGMGLGATTGSATSTFVTEAFDEPSACSTECGDGTLQPGEQCDDGGTQSFDGCAANCRIETRLPPLFGVATGGTVTATIDGVVVQISTVAGQDGAAVASALAATINSSSQIQALYGVATAQSGNVAITGSLDSFAVDDAGLNPASIPALAPAARALLWLGLLAVSRWVIRWHSARR